MSVLSDREKAALLDTAAAVGTDPDLLYKLIDFESGFNPFAQNPYSSAHGLIQFVDKTARELGYIDAHDLVVKNPTVEDQLRGPVKEYLQRYAPLDTKQKLYLSVFYPDARTWPLDRELPEKYQKDNPGIVTVRDYINKVDRKIDARAALIIALAVGGILLYTIISR